MAQRSAGSVRQQVRDFESVLNAFYPTVTDTRLTLPNQAIGTPQFMPPEIALGKPPDGRADLYALGCIMFHALCGRPPFVSEHGAGMIIAAHMRERDPATGSLPAWLPAGSTRSAEARRFTVASGPSPHL